MEKLEKRLVRRRILPQFWKKSVFTALKILMILFYAGYITSCKRNVISESKEVGGLKGRVIYPTGEPVKEARIWNLTKLSSAQTDEKGEFRIEAEENDLLLIQKNQFGFMVKVNSAEANLEITIKPLKEKKFYFTKFEGLQFGGEIFIFIPNTKFISPVLSNGAVFLTYPEGTEEFYLVSSTSFAIIPVDYIEKIPQFGIVDITEIVQRSEIFSEKATITIRDENERSSFKMIFENLSQGERYEIEEANKEFEIPSGIYNIKIQKDKKEFEVPCVFIHKTKEIELKGFEKPSETLYTVKGKATSKYGEKDVLVWVEGTNIMTRSKPDFEISIPAETIIEKKRIFFSRFALFPFSIIPEEGQGQLNIELEFSSYVSGTINSKNKAEFYLKIERQDIQTTEQETKAGLFPVEYQISGEGKTDFLIYMPSGVSFSLIITGTPLLNDPSSIIEETNKKKMIPKVISFSTYDYFVNLGEINLCVEGEEWCIISEGLKALETGRFKEAREIFSFSNEISGKVGFIISSVDLINQNLQIFNLSEKTLKKIDFAEIMRETEEKIGEVEGKIGASEKLCGDRIRIEIPSIFFFLPVPNLLKGCIGETTFTFLKAIYTLSKALYKYLNGHILPSDDFLLSPDLTYFRNLGETLFKSPEIFKFKDFFSPATFIGDIAEVFELVKQSISSAQNCGSTYEVICSNDGKIALRIPQATVNFLSKEANIDAFINSLKNGQKIRLNDILSLFPTDLESDISIDFIRLDLGKLLSNPVRKFFPSVLTDDLGTHYLAVEIEIPEGYNGIKEKGKFIPPLFYIGDSPHFKIFTPILYEDGVYPEGGTDYYTDWIREEFIIYLLFDDPSFGGALELSPCEIAITDEIWKRWNCAENKGKFFTPTNQMFNDVFAVVQKFIGVKLILSQIPFLMF